MMISQTRRISVAGHRGALIPRLFAALSLRRQRHALMGLDDALLADIGLTRDEARIEARRAAWDVPTNWRV